MFSCFLSRVSAGFFGIIVTGLLVTVSAEARVWRCNGVVQFRPCEQEFSIDLTRNERAALPLSGIGTPSPAIRIQRTAPRTDAFAILTQQYRKLSASLGHWYGRIRGNGPTHLYLEIFHKGRRISRRYMGSVNLTSEDKSISFNFTGPLPTIVGWTWKVKAGKHTV